MNIEEVEEFEEKYGKPRFDVRFKHRGDEKTIWGSSEMQWEHTTLRSLANDIYDYLADDYEMWIRETPTFENGHTRMSKKNIRYAMALEADNMTEDGIPLTFRIVSGWLVI